MCYDISFTTDMESVAAILPGLITDGQLELDFDTTHIVAHGHALHPILYRNRDDGALHARLMEWGCIPFYIKDEKQYQRQRSTMLNARSERILDDEKSYWYKIRNRRCLIPVTGIYEHRAVKGWKNKVPYFIRLKDQPVFFLPGLYSVVELPDLETGELLERSTFTLITRNANEVMQMIHNSGEHRGRMPLFLSTPDALKFISAELSPEAYRQLLSFELPAEELIYHPVFTIRSGKPRPDGADKNIYYEWAGLPELGSANPD